MKYRSVALGFAVCICMLAAIPVSAAGVFSAWDYRMKVTFDGYRPSGAETLTNFPALVVLSTNITGFRYSCLLYTSDAADE